MIYTLHVHQTMVKNQNYKWVLKSVAKNSTSDRYVEYPDKVIKELPVSGKICNLNPDMITHDFGRTIKKLGLPHFRFHDLRHYAATIMHAMGVPEAYIMERGGWKTNTVLNQVYRGTRWIFQKNIPIRQTDILKTIFFDSCHLSCQPLCFLLSK